MCSPFAVITAFNPLGQMCSDQENLHEHNVLMREVKQNGWSAVEISGCSPDMEHQEVSVAVALKGEDAFKLAKQFNQNAFYYITAQGELLLSPCLMTKSEPANLGNFSDYLVAKPVTPPKPMKPQW